MPHPAPPFLPPTPSQPLRLPLPSHPTLCLTPYTHPLPPSDQADLIALQNQPLVGRWSYRRAWPYDAAALGSWWDRRGEGYERGRRELEEWVRGRGEGEAQGEGEGEGGGDGAGGGAGEDGEEEPGLPPLIAWPLGCLRYLPPPPPSPPPSDRSVDGADTDPSAPPDPLSDLHLRPGEVVGLAFVYPTDEPAPEGEQSKARPRAETVYGMAYDLDARLHGRKVGKGMLGRMVQWTDWMGVRVVMNIQTDNVASAGLARSMGFRLTKVEEWEWPPEKGGGVRAIGQWERPCGGWMTPEDPSAEVPLIPVRKAFEA